MPRAPRPNDLALLRVPLEPRVSPDGHWVAFGVKDVAPRRDGYRTALWLVPADGAVQPRQLTLGVKNDSVPRWSPDGSALAFLSDRAAVFQAGGGADRAVPQELPRDGVTQVWLLPMEGGEARQLTRFPRDVAELAWSPDGRRLAVVSAAVTMDPEPAKRPEEPPESDIRLIDRLFYQLNGVGFTYDRPGQLWVLDVETGEARRLTEGPNGVRQLAWSPDGRRIAFVANLHPEADLAPGSEVYVVDAEGGRAARISGEGDQDFAHPAWSPSGDRVAAIGHRFPALAGSRNDVWLFPPDTDGPGEDLTAESDLFVSAAMNSDLFGGGATRFFWSADGRTIVFAAPIEGSYELWRVDVATRDVARLTRGEHYLAQPDAVALPDGSLRLAAIRTAGTEPPDVVVTEITTEGGPAGNGAPAAGLVLRKLTNLMGERWSDLEFVAPVTRWHEVDGRRVQGWFLQAPDRRGRPAPVVLEIHGGPQTLYGSALMFEWQVLVGLGISVYACNPRGSQGYGEEFCAANIRDWGDGPMRDCMGGLDAIAAEGRIDTRRMGVTGGSYGGYLTTWIVGHTDRFRTAVTCRSVNDMTSEYLSGDIGGPQFGALELRGQPWSDHDLFWEQSPLRYVERIRTPMLIQHSEKDIRTPINQAEELFAALRALRRPVRLMRVPEETHELTRSGTPFRRVENLRLIVEWFRHFLIEGRRDLPPIPVPGTPQADREQRRRARRVPEASPPSGPVEPTEQDRPPRAR